MRRAVLRLTLAHRASESRLELSHGPGKLPMGLRLWLSAVLGACG